MKLRQIDPIGSYKPRWSRNHFASYQLVFIIGFITLVDYSFWDFAFFIFCRIRDRPHRKFVFYLLTKDRKHNWNQGREIQKKIKCFLQLCFQPFLSKLLFSCVPSFQIPEEAFCWPCSITKSTVSSFDAFKFSASYSIAKIKRKDNSKYLHAFKETPVSVFKKDGRELHESWRGKKKRHRSGSLNQVLLLEKNMSEQRPTREWRLPCLFVFYCVKNLRNIVLLHMIC